MAARSSTSYSRDVDGLALPAPLGGHPALDFCNTIAGWGETDQKDYLVSYDHLVLLAREAGLVAAPIAADLRRRAARRSEGERVLRRAERLRGALYEVLRAPEPGPSWDVVAAEVDAAARATVLVPADGRAEWRFRESVGLALPLLAVARSAGELLASPDLSFVRTCRGHRCGWLFLDRRGRRRWCTMATCGNRAKARRHGARVRTARAS